MSNPGEGANGHHTESIRGEACCGRLLSRGSSVLRPAAGPISPPAADQGDADHHQQRAEPLNGRDRLTGTGTPRRRPGCRSRSSRWSPGRRRSAEKRSITVMVMTEARQARLPTTCEVQKPRVSPLDADSLNPLLPITRKSTFEARRTIRTTTGRQRHRQRKSEGDASHHGDASLPG